MPEEEEDVADGKRGRAVDAQGDSPSLEGNFQTVFGGVWICAIRKRARPLVGRCSPIFPCGVPQSRLGVDRLRRMVSTLD